MVYILAVALLTWGGVFAYMVRLELLTRRLEEELNRQGAKARGEDFRDVPREEVVVR